MMRHYKSLSAILVIFALVFALWPAAALAAGETGLSSDNFSYRVLPGNASVIITGYVGLHPVLLDIPGTVDTGLLGYGVLPVTQISSGAFTGFTDIMSATVPSNVTVIGDGAFAGCSSLTSISLPGTLQTIGEAAFINDTLLSSVTLPNSVTTVGPSAFSGCSSLATVHLSNQLAAISASMFMYCTSLTSIEIPASVTSIGFGAFSQAGLTSIDIPGTVSDIGVNAFLQSGLQHVTLRNGIKTIGEQAFLQCAIDSITIPPSVTSVGVCAFTVCTGLREVTILGSATSLGNTVFTGCISLQKATILITTGSIGNNVFGGAPLTDGIYGFNGSTIKAFADTNNIAFHSIPGLTASPASGNIFTGGRITITPNIKGGSWDYDTDFLSQNGIVFTGLKAGKTRVTYTFGEQSAYVDVTISQSALPQTGQDFTPALGLLILAALAGAVIVLLRKKHSVKKA